MADLQVQDLIDAGIHFGHPASRWNPKMEPYIYGKRNFIHIIDLKESVRGLIRGRKFLTRLVAEGKDVLFVGTKRQARNAVETEAKRCGMPYVSHRWLGGTLTNFKTIRSRLSRLDELEQLQITGEINRFSKKMIASLTREYEKIKRNLEGIRTMEKPPGAMVVVDPVREKNAVRECQKLNIPVVALADTEADPDDVTVVIPGNDDAMRSIEIVLKHLADAVVEGKANRAARAASEGEGQALSGGPSRPKARQTPPETRGISSDGRPGKPEMPPPKPHPDSLPGQQNPPEPEEGPTSEPNLEEAAPEPPNAEPLEGEGEGEDKTAAST